MRVFNLSDPEAARGYDAFTGEPSLEYAPGVFLTVVDEGEVVDADFDAPARVLTTGGLGCDPDTTTPEELAAFVRSPLPERLPDAYVVPDGLTEAQAVAAWRYRSVAEACILRPDSRECVAATVQAGYDLFTDPLSGERNLCLLRAVAVESFLSRRRAPDVEQLVELFPGLEDRKAIQEAALTAPVVDDGVAARYIAATGSEPGGDRVRASLLHRTVVETVLCLDVDRGGDPRRTAAWMNADGLPVGALWRASSMPGAAAVADAVENVQGAQALFDAAVRQGNTPLCLALLRRQDAGVDAGALSAIVTRLRDLEVVRRCIAL